MATATNGNVTCGVNINIISIATVSLATFSDNVLSLSLDCIHLQLICTEHIRDVYNEVQLIGGCYLNSPD